MIYFYVLKIIVFCFLMVLYYKYVKSFMIFCAPHVARHFKWTRYFPVDDIKGAVELAMIAFSHVIFCLLLLYFLPIKWPVFHLNLNEIPMFIIYGILLGIACMGVSGLFCKIAVQIISSCNKDNEHDLKTWLTISRGGWVKHHLQSLEIFPIYLSLLILIMQVGSEEIIFRGILINYFMPFGKFAACLTALVLFVGMQAFLMNRWEAAIFPMIGAAVMGFSHTLLYLEIPILWPLIIAHVTFFLFSVL
jgi:hypothetical protein